MRLFCSNSEHSKWVVLAVELVAHRHLRCGDFAFGGAALEPDLVPGVPGLVRVGLLLVDHAERGVVVLFIAVIDRRSNLLAVLVEIDPERVVLASLMSADVHLEGKGLAGGHREGFHSELIAPDGPLGVVHPEVIGQWLLVLGLGNLGFERTDRGQQVVALILEVRDSASHALHEHHQVLHCLCGGRGSLDADSNLVLGAGQGGEKYDFVSHGCHLLGCVCK